MNEQVVEERTEVAEASVVEGTLVQAQSSEVLPLNYEAAFASYTPQEQQEIMDLSESIDVLRTDNVMHYGGTVLKKTFDQCGELLKKERGSQADQEVMAMVSELSKQAKDSYEDFNMLIKVKEPNFIQKMILAIKNGKSWSEAHTQMVQKSAVTNYDLLMKLKESESVWLDMLREADVQITESAMSDIETGTLLEKFIIAGKMAESRIAQQLEDIKEMHQQTGLQKYAYEYDELQRGYEMFTVKMSKLEQSRVMYQLSVAQLGLTKRSNQNVRLTITSEMEHSMALMGQQLRNALLDAKTREVMDGYKAISHLNDELIQKVCENVGLTGQESEELIYAAFYDVEAAKTAITSVINCCHAIEKIAGEKLPQMKANTEELAALIQELEPYVNSVKASDDGATTSVSTKKGDGKLEF